MSCWKPQVSFSLNFVSLFSAIRKIPLLYFFSWNFIWFRQKEPIKMQSFRLSTTHVKFHRMCTLIVFFYWKYIKFQAKKYREVMSHDTEHWCKIYLLFYFIYFTLICYFKNDKNSVNFDLSTRNSQSPL